MIITYTRNYHDWIWLRCVFDIYRNHYKEKLSQYNSGHILAADFDYAARKIHEKIGVKTKSTLMDYKLRTFVVEDDEKFMIAKLSRDDDDYHASIK